MAKRGKGQDHFGPFCYTWLMTQHRLSNINEVTRTADCQNCGTGITIYKKSRPDGRGWRCSIKHKSSVSDLRYGLTKQERLNIAESQNHRCAICGKHKPLMVDHDHETGLVRDLLCGTCNSGIGMLNDDITTLKVALAYLQRHKSRSKI